MMSIVIELRFVCVCVLCRTLKYMSNDRSRIFKTLLSVLSG